MEKSGDMLVKGKKVNTIEGLTNDEGFFGDQFGNKIYPTEGKENQERLAALKKVAKKKTAPKKATKKKD